MEILGIGPSELVFIIIIALIVLGPKDMQKAGRTIGKWLRQIVTSDGWKLFQQTSREIQTLPNRLMREAALDELKEMQKDLQQPLETNRRQADPVLLPGPQTPQAEPSKTGIVSQPENQILPPTPPDSPSKDKEENA
jgi:sec-independent protein translocase protein TatB